VRRGLALAAIALLLGGCGGDDPDPLERGDAERLAYARERLDDAIDTEEVLRTDRTEARRLRRVVAADNLPNVVPSLVDERTRRDFLRYATSDAARALRRPAEDAVLLITTTLEGKDRDERIRTLGRQTVAGYLREAERDTEPIWPDLARRLADL